MKIKSVIKSIAAVTTLTFVSLMVANAMKFNDGSYSCGNAPFETEWCVNPYYTTLATPGTHAHIIHALDIWGSCSAAHSEADRRWVYNGDAWLSCEDLKKGPHTNWWDN